jgi:hypothetical protein
VSCLLILLSLPFCVVKQKVKVLPCKSLLGEEVRCLS